MIKKAVKKETTKKEVASTHKVKGEVAVKKAASKPVAAKKEEKAVSKGRYIEAVGRRKTSIARVRLMINESGIKINGKDYKDYLKLPKLQEIVNSPLSILELKDKYGFTVVVSGGGVFSQAEAIRHGITRSLIKLDAEFRKRLKRYGFITRDSRMVERKKPGLKKARKAPQWAKR
jgi:small subunit ribosomal protein S9